MTAADPVVSADPEMSRLQAVVAEELALAEAEPAEAKALYRALARRCHPDLGSGDADRERRRTFMIWVNDAYARGDVDLLRLLALEWDGDAAVAVSADGSSPDRLSRLRSTVAAARGRLARVRADLADVTGSGLGPLLFRERPQGLEAALGRLDVLAGQLRSRIGERRRVLADLTGARP